MSNGVTGPPTRLSVKDAATTAGVSEGTVTWWHRQGYLPGVMHKHKLSFLPADVEKAANRVRYRPGRKRKKREDLA